MLLFSKQSNLNTVKQTFLNILSDINKWANCSDPNISVNKCKFFHICRKLKCNNIDLIYINVNIINTNSIKFHGLIFDKRITFKGHCIYIRKQLAVRLNIIKYLSSKHCLIHIPSLKKQEL